MESSHAFDHPKKRRRRLRNKNALSARLVLDDSLRGDAGVLSDDLYSDLFPNATTSQGELDFLVCLTSGTDL